MKKLSKILTLCLVCAVAIGCAVYFTPSSSAEAESITKNLWSIDDSYLSNYQNVKLDTNPNKKTYTIDFVSSGNGDGATSNIPVVNGATYTASCVYSFDNYQATSRRFVFLVYCYDTDGNKMTSTGLINGLDYESSYDAYGVSYVGNSAITTDLNYSVSFTINSINIAYVAVKFGIYDSDKQTGATIKLPMVELGDTKTEYIKSDKGYAQGYKDASVDIYNDLAPTERTFYEYVYHTKYVGGNLQEWYSLESSYKGFVNNSNWVENPSYTRTYTNNTTVTFSGYYTDFGRDYGPLLIWELKPSGTSLGSLTLQQFLESEYNVVYYINSAGNLYSISKNVQSLEDMLSSSYDKGQQKGFEAGIQSASDTARSEGYDVGFVDGKNKGYQDGLRDGEGALSIGLGTVQTLFSGIASLLNVKVFGSVPLGAFLGIPLLFGLVLFVLKIVRG